MSLVLVLLEPVRSAEPPMSSGITGARRLEHLLRGLRVASFGASADDALLERRRSRDRAAAAGRPRSRRSNSARLARCAACRFCQASQLGSPRWPAARQAARIVVGDHERRIRPAELRARAARSPRRRAASRGPPRCPPCFGAPKPMIVRQAISDGWSLACARSSAAATRFGIVAVDALGRPAGGLEARELIVGDRRAMSGRRWRCGCRRTARSAC